MPWMAAAAVAAPIVGGLVGNVMSQGDRNAAKKAMKQAMAELEAVGYPPDMSAQIIYKQFEQVGILTPELEEDIGLAASEYNNIKEDSAIRDTQLEALNKFKQQSQGGLAGDERAAMNEILNKQRQEQQAAQANILANQQRQGMGGGAGAGLIAQLQATQSAAGNAAGQGMDLMSLLAQRVRSGTQDMSSAAQNVRSQDYNVAQDKAAAIDARNQYLNQNSVARQTRNVGALNNAQAANLGAKQSTADANTQMYNNEKLRQNQAQRQYWQDKLDYGTAKANALTGQASNFNKQAQATANMGQQIGSGAGQMIAGYNQYQNSQPATRSGYGGDTPANEYDDYYMNKVK